MSPRSGKSSLLSARRRQTDDEKVTTQVPPATTDTTPAFLVDFANANVASPVAIAKTALRYEYEGWDAALAYIASGGELTADDIARLAARIGAGHLVDAADLVPLQATGLYALAYLAVGQA